MKIPTYIAGNVQTKAYRLLREHVYTALIKYELTPMSWSALGIIVESRNGVRQSEIAHALHVKPPLITLIVQDLKKHGIVQIAPNQFDARAKLLAITPSGKKLIKIVEDSLSKCLDQLLTGLTNDELLTYHKVLSTIIANSTKQIN